MNEIEQIILQSLRHLGCDFVNSTGESIDTLELLSSDEIIEAVIRLLWQCDPKFRTEITSCKTPSSSHTLERFKLANQIVRCLKKIGIDQEFQGLLYPSTYETRRIFMSLLEKMPKEEIKIEPIKLSPIEQMRLNIARILFEQLKRTWQRRCEQSEGLDSDENYESMRKHFQPSRAYVSHIRSFLEDDQDLHLQQNWIKTRISPKEDQDLAITIPTQTNKVLGNDAAKVSKKPPPLLPKPTGLGSRKGKAFISECEASTSNMEVKIDEGLTSSTLSPSQASNPMEKLVDRILKRRIEISTIREKIVEAERFNAIKTNDLTNLRKANEERDMDRILELIQDPETSLTKLTKIVSEADERRSALEQKFILARDAKLSELNKLLPHDASNDKPYCDGIATTLQNKIDNMEEELSAKLRIKSKLQKELAKRKILEENEITDEAVQPKIKRSNPRRKYLRRILEICANINSQNAEITKMVKSINTLNHEIGNLSGNLDRTWIAVDKWLSKLAEQDPRMQQAYKQLLRIHGHCAAVREAITEVGQLSRNIDELTDKNELQDQQTNSIDDQFQKLLDDLLQVKDENTRLTRQLEKSN